MEATVIRLLREKGLKIATAESCTGGLISHRLTNVPGSSEVFTHGWITYANEAKTGQLGVPAEIISMHGAVSEETARAMAEGALIASNADLALAITGIAGPTGGTEDKPVGTAWLALAEKGGATTVRKIYHPRNRKDFKDAASQSALDLIRRRLSTTR
jgi:nicotinamide-nucleotide amidase